MMAINMNLERIIPPIYILLRLVDKIHAATNDNKFALGIFLRSL